MIYESAYISDRMNTFTESVTLKSRKIGFAPDF